jgi:hypothetical protein
MTSFPRDRNGNPTLESWDLFVVRHQKPSNLAGHFISFLLFSGSPLNALLTSQPMWLVGFFISGGVGALICGLIFQEQQHSLASTRNTPICWSRTAARSYRESMHLNTRHLLPAAIK